MILESERLLAEDLERLEQAIADRLLEEPKAVSLSHPALWASRAYPHCHPSFLLIALWLTKVILSEGRTELISPAC